MAILSAGNRELQKEKLKVSDIDTKQFEYIFIAEDGSKKPYYSIISNLNELTLVVGDKIRKDLAPAKALGFYTAHINIFNRPKLENSCVDFTITDIMELVPIIRELKLKHESQQTII